MTLSELCLRRPVLAVVASVLIAVFGIAALGRLPVRELPDVDTAEVTVSVSYLGAAPAVVDAEVTTVIERAVSGVPGIRSISSEAELGGSRSVIEFDTTRDIDNAANDVRAAVQAVAADLPEEADPPEVQKNDSQSEPVVRLTLTSDRLSPAELTDYAERSVIDRLETVDGVASVEIYGERAFAMRIWLDPQAMAARGVTVGDVREALENNNVELPAGEIETASRTFQVRTETRLADPAAFEDLILRAEGGLPVRLGEVARVELGVESDDSAFRANGTAAIGLGVLRQSRSNTIAISEAVREAVERVGAGLPEGMALAVSSDDAVFIRASIVEVLKTLAIAVALVVAVIFVFLASARATIVPAVTIPIALLGACAGIALAGFSINILTLFALILAIGLVVDDAIVVLENIERRVEKGESPLLASALGSRQVTVAVIATTLTLIAVFLPLSFLQGEVGRLFTEFGIVLSIAVAVSTFVALTLCPVICARVLKPGAREGRFARLVDGAFERLAGGYRRALGAAIRAPALVLAAAALLSGAAVALYEAIPKDLTPEEDRGVFFVSVDAPQGSNLAYTDAAVREVEARLAPLREEGVVEDVLSIVGRYGEVASAFLVVSLSDWSERDRTPQELVSELRPAFAAITRAEVRAFAPSGLGVGGGSGIDAVVSAPSFEAAAEWSAALERALREDDALTDVDRDYALTQPGYDIRVDRERARDLGIDVAAVSRALQALFASAEVTEFIDRDRQYPVILQAEEAGRDGPGDLSRVTLRAEGGAVVPLDGLIEVERRASVQAYNRYDRQPSVEVSAQLADGVDLGTGIERVEAAAADLPEGASIAFTGAAQDFLRTGGGVTLVFGAALLVVFLVLAAQFESFVHPVIVMLSVPLAATGALVTLTLAGQSLNIYSQVGLVMLIGLMAKNAILIVEFANQLRDEGREVRDAVLEASVVRLRPILMTVASTVLGAVPLVLSSGAGAEARGAIGLVIIGGFASASVLTLFLTPVLYDLLAPFARPRGAVQRRLEEELGASGGAEAASP